MTLRYYRPRSGRLAQVVSFGLLDEPADVFNQRFGLPDAQPALMFNLGAPLVWAREAGTALALPRAFFIGARTRPVKLRATGACQTVGVNLAAWGARLFVDEQADLSAGPIVPLGGAWLDLTQLLAATLARQGELAALHVLEQFVEDWGRRAHPDVSSARRAVEQLARTGGGGGLPQLAAHCALSPSALERQARYLTGQTPKALARLIRFDAACAGLLRQPAGRLTDLAHACGYADQAHCIHEFQALAGCTPRAARGHIQQLAASAEFLQLS